MSPFRSDRVGHLDVLARQAVRWCRDHADEIANADLAHPTYCAAIAACIFSAAASSEKDRHLRSSHRVLPPSSRGPDGECVSTDRAGAAN